MHCRTSLISLDEEVARNPNSWAQNLFRGPLPPSSEDRPNGATLRKCWAYQPNLHVCVHSVSLSISLLNCVGWADKPNNLQQPMLKVAPLRTGPATAGVLLQNSVLAENLFRGPFPRDCGGRTGRGLFYKNS